MGRLEDTFLAFVASLSLCFILKLNVLHELPYLGELIFGSVWRKQPTYQYFCNPQEWEILGLRRFRPLNQAFLCQTKASHNCNDPTMLGRKQPWSLPQLHTANGIMYKCLRLPISFLNVTSIYSCRHDGRVTNDSQIFHSPSETVNFSRKHYIR